MTETRRIVRIIGDPELRVKIYDRVQQDRYLDTLCSLMADRKMPGLAFAGVGHIYYFEGRNSADFQLYGRHGMENVDHVFPHRVDLETGLDYTWDRGRACLDETIIFGKEAELLKKIWDQRGVVDEETVKAWFKRFAA